MKLSKRDSKLLSTKFQQSVRATDMKKMLSDLKVWVIIQNLQKGYSTETILNIKFLLKSV